MCVMSRAYRLPLQIRIVHSLLIYPSLSFCSMRATRTFVTAGDDRLSNTFYELFIDGANQFAYIHKVVIIMLCFQLALRIVAVWMWFRAFAILQINESNIFAFDWFSASWLNFSCKKSRRHQLDCHKLCTKWIIIHARWRWCGSCSLRANLCNSIEWFQ